MTILPLNVTGFIVFLPQQKYFFNNMRMLVFLLRWGLPADSSLLV